MEHMLYAKSISWIDDCRIPYTKGDVDKINFDRPRVREHANPEWILKQAYDHTNPDFKEYNTDGRFPANILVCDDMLNDGNVGQNNSKNQEWKLQYKSESHIYGKYKGAGISRIADKGTNSRYYDIDKWFENLLESCE